MNLNTSEGELDQQLDDYQVINKERTDPFGIVFTGKQKKLRKSVRIRVLPLSGPSLTEGGNDLQEYFAACASIQHFSLLGIDEYGNLKLDGFGLSGFADLLRPHFDTSNISRYIAPEESANQINTSPSADLYSIGACLYECLTGSVPQGVFPMPSEVNPALGKGFDSIISTALQSSPETRFASADAFAKALESVETPPQTPSPRAKTGPVSPEPAPFPITGPTVAVPARPRRQSTGLPKPAELEKNFPWNIVGISVGLLVILGGGFWFLSRPPKVSNELSTVRVTDSSIPSDVQVTDRSTSTISLDWRDLAGNDGSIKYKIRRNGLLIATTKTSEYFDDELDPDSKYIYRISSVDASGNESYRSPELAGWTDQSNEDRFFRLIRGIRFLHPHCPDLKQKIQSNRTLLALVNKEDEIDSLTTPEALRSEEFVNWVSGVYDEARLPKPRREVRSGTLVGWTKDSDSELPAGEFLPNFSGDGRDIVSIAGSIQSGIALNRDGSVSTWGVAQVPPAEVRDVVAVDSEDGHFAALTETGTVYVWGNPSITQSDVSSWQSVSRISLGKNHILAVTEDFKVLSAGSNTLVVQQS